MMSAMERQVSERLDGTGVSHIAVDSSLGELTLVKQSDELVGLYYPGHRPAPPAASLGTPSTEGFDDFERQLSEYLAGARRHFDLPHRAIGTDHDQRVWALVADIPYGSVSTYGQLARDLHDGTTALEVGTAMARNPLSIVIPCHRVVRANGRLAGYTGGLKRKRLLLDLERGVAGSAGQLF
jgi:methylated-DNA-[protein]-cysteine S-methyltransferase